MSRSVLRMTTQIISLRLPAELYLEVEAVREATGETRTDLIARAVARELRRLRRQARADVTYPSSEADQ
jgi:metal-responsive CopG/Arc/MetJ family transcriptional regulator